MKLSKAVEAIQSRTVWCGIISFISLVVYFRTGVVLESVGIDHPDVIEAVNKVTGVVALLAQLGVPYFRVNHK